MLSLGLRSEESLSLSVTVSCPRSLGDHVLNVTTGACGKTSLLCSFALGEFPKEYVSLHTYPYSHRLIVSEATQSVTPPPARWITLDT